MLIIFSFVKYNVGWSLAGATVDRTSMLDLKTTFRARKFTRRIINSLNLNAEEFLMSDKVLQAAEIGKIHANVE